MERIIDDPAVVAKLAAQMQSASSNEVDTEKPVVNNYVKLPGGFANNGVLIKEAEIRELVGADEEAIAKAAEPSKALLTVLKRGLVSLGGVTPNDAMLDTLLAGDRDAILLGIYKATFGSEVTYAVSCTGCGVLIAGGLNLDEDVKVKELEDPINEREFSVKTKLGLVSLSLPNGVTQRRLMENPAGSMAENVTTILSGCIYALNGEPVVGITLARELGLADRANLITEIYNRTPGPRLGEVTKVCEACSSEYTVPLSLAALFRLQ